MYICIYYEGPLQISATALNGIPSGNKVYLIWFDFEYHYGPTLISGHVLLQKNN